MRWVMIRLRYFLISSKNKGSDKIFIWWYGWIMKNLTSKIRSNIFFIIPLGIALYLNMWALWAILTIVIVFSLLYHRTNEKKWQIYDEVFAIFLMAYNLYLCFVGNFTEPYFVLSMISVILALWFYTHETKLNYEYNHSLRHIFSATITTLCILVYIR